VLLVRVGLLLVMPLLAAGCMSMVGMAAAPGAAIGTTVASGKTPVDHLVSVISGKNCSIRRNRQGLTYCLEDEETPPVRVVCYRTLGDVSCYDSPDPYNGRQRAIVEDLGAAQMPFASGTRIHPGLLPGPVAAPELADPLSSEPVSSEPVSSEPLPSDPVDGHVESPGTQPLTSPTPPTSPIAAIARPTAGADLL
jgi:hypothetical protein